MTESAGIVLLRRRQTEASQLESPQAESPLEILLVHPGGPFWAKKDTHGWSIPKGEFDPAEEDGETAAFREFEEELGHPVPAGPRVALAPFRAGKKRITAWLVEPTLDATADWDLDNVVSNTFEMEWPPKSGQLQSFPEVDRAAWYTLDDAATKLHKGQLAILSLIGDAAAEMVP